MQEASTGGTSMKRIVVALALACSFAGVALAADEFYIVQDTKTKKCTIIDKKPTVSTMTA
jgi:hypothetical protein